MGNEIILSLSAPQAALLIKTLEFYKKNVQLERYRINNISWLLSYIDVEMNNFYQNKLEGNRENCYHWDRDCPIETYGEHCYPGGCFNFTPLNKPRGLR